MDTAKCRTCQGTGALDADTDCPTCSPSHVCTDGIRRAGWVCPTCVANLVRAVNGAVQA